MPKAVKKWSTTNVKRNETKKKETIDNYIGF